MVTNGGCGVIGRGCPARSSDVGNLGNVVGGSVGLDTGVCLARPVTVVEVWDLVGAGDGGVVDGFIVGVPDGGACLARPVDVDDLGDGCCRHYRCG